MTFNQLSEVGLELSFTQTVRTLIEKRGNTSNGSGIGVDSAFSLALTV